MQEDCLAQFRREAEAWYAKIKKEALPMKKLLCLVLGLILLLSVSGSALAVNEDVEGELVMSSLRPCIKKSCR